MEYFIPNPISPHVVVHVSVSHGLGALTLHLPKLHLLEATVKLELNHTKIRTLSISI